MVACAGFCWVNEVNFQRGRRKSSGGDERIVFCLCIDIIGSTTAGLQMDSRQRNEFNKLIVKQIEPYLAEFELRDALLKFNGDGWLVMRPGEESIPPLVALAKTLCARFQHDIRSRLRSEITQIPGIRTSLFSGHDMAVIMPGSAQDKPGKIDWVGDSARRATRFNACCGQNELFVDYTVYSVVHLDFICEKVLLKELPKKQRPKHDEEDIAIYKIGELKPPLSLKIADDEDYYTMYAKYLRAIGELRKAETLAGEIHAAVASQVDAKVADHIGKIERQSSESVPLVQESANPQRDQPPKTLATGSEELDAEKIRSTLMGLLYVAPSGRVRTRIEKTLQEIGFELGVVNFNSLISRSPDYDTALGWYKEMTAKGVAPNEVTYNTLVNISPDYDTALGWYKEMTAKGVAPNEVTYNTLVNISPDYDTALGWYKEMTAKGVAPNKVTHSALAKKVPDFATGVNLTNELYKLGRYLGQGYFTSLFSKDISNLSAEEFLTAYHTLPNRHEKGLEPAIWTYRRHRKYKDAFHLCLFAPHLEAAKKLYRDRPDDAERFFVNVLEVDQNYSNALYGLGVCLFENGQHRKAEPFLRRARALAYAAPRIAHIDRMLAVIRELGAN
jgi:tetratricopeptide (TPR) repeat protein